MVTKQFGQVYRDYFLNCNEDTRYSSRDSSVVLTFKISLCFRCVLFMWLFSDLHALEVELWIHCFCTRRTPFKSSDCYHANLCLVWRFSVMTCFHAHNISNVFTLMSKTNNQCWDLNECILGSGLDSGYFMYQRFFLGYNRVTIEHAPPLKGFCPGLFFTTCLSHHTILHDQSVKQIISGYFYGVLHCLIFCWVLF